MGKRYYARMMSEINAVLDDLEAEREGIEPVECNRLGCFPRVEDRDGRLIGQAEERPNDSILNLAIKGVLISH